MQMCRQGEVVCVCACTCLSEMYFGRLQIGWLVSTEFHYLSVAFICSSSEKSSYLSWITRRATCIYTYTAAHKHTTKNKDGCGATETECDMDLKRFYDKKYNSFQQNLLCCWEQPKSGCLPVGVTALHRAGKNSLLFTWTAKLQTIAIILWTVQNFDCQQYY